MNKRSVRRCYIGRQSDSFNNRVTFAFYIRDRASSNGSDFDVTHRRTRWSPARSLVSGQIRSSAVASGGASSNYRR